MDEDRFPKEQCVTQIVSVISPNPVAILPTPKPQYCEAVWEKELLFWSKDDKAEEEWAPHHHPT